MNEPKRTKFYKRLNAGLCTRCGHEPRKEGDGLYCEPCGIKERARGCLARKMRVQRWREAQLCTGCGGKRESEASQCCKCRNRGRKATAKSREKRIKNQSPEEKKIIRFSARERESAWRASKKLAVIAGYGGKCECCGETHPIFLTIDHKKDNGQEDRKRWPNNISFYHHLIKTGFPKEDYALLCFNCNLGRHYNGGTCPHQNK